MPSISSQPLRRWRTRKLRLSLIADAEAARAKAMAEKGGASAAVSAVIAKAKLSGMWREKPELTKSGPVTVNVVWPNAN